MSSLAHQILDILWKDGETNRGKNPTPAKPYPRDCCPRG